MPAPTSTETYNKLVVAFRERPGNIQYAAEQAGVRWPTAKRAWSGPAKPLRPDQRPIRDVLADEAAALVKVQTDREAEEAKAREEVAAEMKRKQELRTEASKAEENILRLARSSTLNGVGALATMAKGVGMLAKRVGDHLERGVDAKGNPLDINPLEALRIVHSYSTSLNRFTDAAQALIAIERLKEGLPTDLIGVTVTHDVSLAQVEESVGDAARALERARRLELLPGGKKDTA